MGEVIAVVSGKGGVGKSSVVLNLGETLAMMNHSVCLIDMDLGLKNLDYMMGLENRVVYDMKDVMDHKCTLKQALLQDKYHKNLSLLPACKSIHIKEFDDTRMKEIVDLIKQDYDYVLLDSAAGIEKGFYSAISCVKKVILVTTLDVTALQDADRVIGILMQKGMEHISFLVNRYQEKNVERGICISLKEAKQWLAVEFLGYIFEDEELQRFHNLGKPAVLKPSMRIAQCFNIIARRMKGEHVELPKAHTKSILAKLFG